MLSRLDFFSFEFEDVRLLMEENTVASWLIDNDDVSWLLNDPYVGRSTLA